MRLQRLFLGAFVIASALAFSGGARSEPESSAQAPKDPPPSPGSRAPEIEAAVRALVKTHGLDGAEIGVVVMDCETGAVLAQHGEHTPLNPASNAKLYTAAAALAILHGNHRYQTTLSGTIKGGAATGLVLRGLGDPSLQSRDLWALAQELKSHGVKKIEGDITVDQRFFDDLTTPPAFEQQPNEWASFRAPVSAVAVNENTVTLTIRPQSAGNPAIAFFDPPGFVDVEGAVKTSESGADTVGLDLVPNGKRLKAKLSGAVGADSKLVRYTRRVDDPQVLAGYVLKAALEDTGLKGAGEVKLLASGIGKSKAKGDRGDKSDNGDDDTGDDKPEKSEKPEKREKRGSTLARHESEPLSTLLYALGKNSDNFYAEMVFKSISAEAKTRPAKSQDSAEIVMKWLERNELGDTGVVIKNGSGLFDSNRVTATSMAKLLRYGWQEPTIHHEFLAQLAIGGVDGTLHRRFRSLSNHRAVRAKTGTLDSAIALSGYVLAPKGKGTIAYAIMFNKVSGHASEARIAADKLVDKIHDRLWK